MGFGALYDIFRVMSTIKSYKDLLVWQKAIDLCEEIYICTKVFPSNEIYGLTSQLRRCSVSIPSNIAEGHFRGHRTEYIHFLYIAYGSGAELGTQLYLANRIGYFKNDDYNKLASSLEEVMKMLNKLITSLKPKT